MNDCAFQDGIHIQDLRNLFSRPGRSELRPCVRCDQPCLCGASPTRALSRKPDYTDLPVALLVACIWPADGSSVHWNI